MPAPGVSSVPGTRVSCADSSVTGAAPDRAVSSAAVTRLEIRTGDVIRILTKYREPYTLKLTALDANAMSGETVRLKPRDPGSAHESVKVRYADVALIEVKRRSGVRTAAAALVAIEVIGLVVLGVEGVPIGMPAP